MDFLDFLKAPFKSTIFLRFNDYLDMARAKDNKNFSCPWQEKFMPSARFEHAIPQLAVLLASTELSSRRYQEGQISWNINISFAAAFKNLGRVVQENLYMYMKNLWECDQELTTRTRM